MFRMIFNVGKLGISDKCHTSHRSLEE